MILRDRGYSGEDLWARHLLGGGSLRFLSSLSLSGRKSSDYSLNQRYFDLVNVKSSHSPPLFGGLKRRVGVANAGAGFIGFSASVAAFAPLGCIGRNRAEPRVSHRFARLPWAGGLQPLQGFPWTLVVQG